MKTRKWLLLGFDLDYYVGGCNVNMVKIESNIEMKEWRGYVNNIKAMYYREGIFNDDIIRYIDYIYKDMGCNKFIDCNCKIVDRFIDFINHIDIEIIINRNADGYLKKYGYIIDMINKNKLLKNHEELDMYFEKLRLAKIIKS